MTRMPRRWCQGGGADFRDDVGSGQGQLPRRLGGRSIVGAVVLIVVLGLQLFPRLSAGQDLLDGLEPAVTPDRIATARGGVDAVSTVVEMADPLMLAGDPAAGEVPALVAFVAQGTGLSEPEVVAALAENFPHTLGLLNAIPLESVASESGELVAFLAETLAMSPEDVLAAIETNFPRLHQAIAHLPAVTSGWADVPDTPGTLLDGGDVASVPDVMTYFSQDVIPVLESQGERLRDVSNVPGGIGRIPALLTALAVLAIVLGGIMYVVSGEGGTPRALAAPAWGAVALVGGLVLLLVFGYALFPRLSNAHLVLRDAEPVFSDDGVTTAVGGITIVSDAADTLDPIMLESGGAASEVPQLVALVAEQTGLAEADVLGILGERFPHVLGLLQALPLEAVDAEVPGLVAFLATSLGTTPDDVMAAIADNFPGLAQALVTLPTVVAQWQDVPNTPGTSYAGGAIDSIPDVRDYFRGELIPTVGAGAEDFRELNTTWPPTYFLPAAAHGGRPAGTRLRHRDGPGRLHVWAPGSLRHGREVARRPRPRRMMETSIVTAATPT